MITTRTAPQTLDQVREFLPGARGSDCNRRAVPRPTRVGGEDPVWLRPAREDRQGLAHSTGHRVEHRCSPVVTPDEAGRRVNTVRLTVLAVYKTPVP